jgi:hypothetical protein
LILTIGSSLAIVNKIVMFIPDFPEFTPLRLEDKDSYEKLIAEFPHNSDIAFATLHIWWNLEDKLSVSLLNGNMVINYHLPGDAQNSGYGLIGRQHIDASIKAALEYLMQERLPPRLVHVPEFVVNEIRLKDYFKITEELDYNEYILDSNELATLRGGKYANNRKDINRFLRSLDGKLIEAKSIDLSTAESQEELLQIIRLWEKKHPWKNDPGRAEYDALAKTLEYGSLLEIQNLGFYIGGVLFGIIFYHTSEDGQYYIMHHLKVDNTYDYIVDYIEQFMAIKAVSEGIPYINMEIDLGIQGLREHKLGLKPIHFLKKYTIALATASNA